MAHLMHALKDVMLPRGEYRTVVEYVTGPLKGEVVDQYVTVPHSAKRRTEIQFDVLVKTGAVYNVTGEGRGISKAILREWGHAGGAGN